MKNRLPEGFDGSDFFPDESEYTVSPLTELSNSLGEMPEYLSPDGLLGPKVAHLVPAVLYFRKSRMWAVEVKMSELQASKLGTKIQKGLLGRRSITSSQPLLHDLRLMVLHNEGSLVFEPPIKKVQAKTETLSDKKSSLLQKGKRFFGESGFKLSGSEGSYRMTIVPALKRFKGIFATSSTGAKTIEELDGRLDEVIQKLGGIKDNPTQDDEYTPERDEEKVCKQFFEAWARMAQIGDLMPHSKHEMATLTDQYRYGFTEQEARRIIDCGKKGYASIAGHSREQWLVSVYRMADLEKKIERFERKTAKLKMKNPIRLEIMGEKAMPIFDDHGEKTPFVKMYKIIELHGEPPVISGYRFIAKVMHTEAGNIVSKAPGAEDVKLPKSLWNADATCDHCKKDRRRSETFVLQKVSGNKLIRVGRSCLADFLRSSDIDAALSLWSMLEQIQRESSDSDEDYGGRGNFFFDMIEFLAVTWNVIEKVGWISRAFANTNNKESTADTVSWAMYPLSSQADQKTRELYESLMPTPAARAVAHNVLVWASALKPTSDYEMNLKVLSNLEYVPTKSTGFVASMVVAYKRAMGEEILGKKKASGPEKVNEWFGIEGAQYIKKLNIIRTHDIDGHYGLTTLVIMEDEDGRSFKWFASGRPQHPRYAYDNPKGYENLEKDKRESKSLETGDSLWFYFTIKKHDTWTRKDGKVEMSTVVTRASASEEKQDAKWIDSVGRVFKTKKALLAEANK